MTLASQLIRYEQVRVRSGRRRWPRRSRQLEKLDLRRASADFALRDLDAKNGG